MSFKLVGFNRQHLVNSFGRASLEHMVLFCFRLRKTVTFFTDGFHFIFMKVPRFRLLFFGTDNFSVIVLRYLLARELCPIQVVTKRGSLLGKFSNENHLNLHYWPLNNRSIYQPFNIGLVASFGHLIDVDTVNQFKYGLFNVHPSLLPQYRGSTPVQAAIREGISETGCTIMKIPPVLKFDIGHIVMQQRVSIEDEEYAIELRDRLAYLGATLFERFILDYEQHIVETKPQIASQRSYAKKLKPEDGHIKFKTESSEEIDRKVRAYAGFINLFTYCLHNLKIYLEGMKSIREVETYDLNKLSLDIEKNVIDNNVPAGTIHFHKVRKLVCINCSDGKWVAFEFVKPAYKPRMSASDFYNGYLSKVNPSDRRTDT